MSPRWPVTVEVLSSGSQWRVVVGGSTKSHHRKKQRAVSKGRSIAKDRGGRLKIQGQDGRWQDIRDYS